MNLARVLIPDIDGAGTVTLKLADKMTVRQLKEAVIKKVNAQRGENIQPNGFSLSFTKSNDDELDEDSVFVECWKDGDVPKIINVNCVLCAPKPEKKEQHRRTTSEFTEHQGYLTKMGGSYRSWKRRFFVVKDSKLNYYVSESALGAGKPPKGIVNLPNSTILHFAYEQYNKKHCFGITDGKSQRTFVFFADSEREKLQWMKFLTPIIRKFNILSDKKTQSSSATPRPKPKAKLKERDAGKTRVVGKAQIEDEEEAVKSKSSDEDSEDMPPAPVPPSDDDEEEEEVAPRPKTKAPPSAAAAAEAVEVQNRPKTGSMLIKNALHAAQDMEESSDEEVDLREDAGEGEEKLANFMKKTLAEDGEEVEEAPATKTLKRKKKKKQDEHRKERIDLIKNQQANRAMAGMFADMFKTAGAVGGVRLKPSALRKTGGVQRNSLKVAIEANKLKKANLDQEKSADKKKEDEEREAAAAAKKRELRAIIEENKRKKEEKEMTDEKERRRKANEARIAKREAEEAAAQSTPAPVVATPDSEPDLPEPVDDEPDLPEPVDEPELPEPAEDSDDIELPPPQEAPELPEPLKDSDMDEEMDMDSLPPPVEPPVDELPEPEEDEPAPVPVPVPEEDEPAEEKPVQEVEKPATRDNSFMNPTDPDFDLPPPDVDTLKSVAEEEKEPAPVAASDEKEEKTPAGGLRMGTFESISFEKLMSEYDSNSA